MADVHGSPADAGLQMPQAGAGPAPVPYAGPALQPEPPDYAAAPLGMSPADGYVVHGVTNLGTMEDPSAYDVNAGLVTSYYAGAISAVNAAGDADAGGVDTVAGEVAAAVANATGRWREHEGDAHAGATIGDLLQFPPSPLDPGAGVGNTSPAGGFYDPPRGYGGAEGAPGYVGNEPPPGYQGEAQ